MLFLSNVCASQSKVNQSIHQFVNVTTWDRVAPSIRAGGACIKRMTIIITNNTIHDNNLKGLKMYIEQINN